VRVEGPFQGGGREGGGKRKLMEECSGLMRGKEGKSKERETSTRRGGEPTAFYEGYKGNQKRGRDTLGDRKDQGYY